MLPLPIPAARSPLGTQRPQDAALTLRKDHLLTPRYCEPFSAPGSWCLVSNILIHPHLTSTQSIPRSPGKGALPQGPVPDVPAWGGGSLPVLLSVSTL